LTAPVRIAVIGCADIARRKMLPAMARTAGAEVVAIASRDPAKAAEQANRFGGRPVHGYAEVLSRTDVEAVYIPLPAALHAEWIAAALSAGKHVLAEKPLTAEPALSSELFRLARSKGLTLMENVMFVHHAQHAAVQRLIADGAIGELRAFHGTFTIPALAAGDIRYAPGLGGGALLDLGLYPVRAALSLLGSALTVAGAVLGSEPGRLVDTTGAALLRNDGRVAAHVTFGFEHAYRSSYTLGGSEGWLTVNRAFTPPPDYAPVLTLDGRNGIETIRLEPDDQAANAVAAFAAAVRTGESPGSAETMRQAEILADIRRSADKVGCAAALRS